MADLVAWWLGPFDGRAAGDDGWWEQDADEPAYAASLVKVPLAVAAEDVDLDRAVLVHADFASAVGGRFTLDRDDDQDDATWDAVGEHVTLRELRRRAIVESSNIATNLLLEEVGVPAVQRVLAAAGCSDRTTVTRGIGDLAARDAGLANDVTARDLARLLRRVPPAVEDVMRGQAHREAIPAGLPSGPDAPVVANKTGWVDGITHDMAIVRPVDAEPFVLVVLTRTDESHEAAQERIAAIAAEAWQRAGERRP
ncbi:serine hydrolase [Nocardioides dongxiaopingii]|uniref:serine hydrolase n=1 Tax=Nocardioides dongxiaopingii TaxID=2576036 RepID=UPI0014853EA6|nr:serine hydrolase [Nocardioides dongxiaopingii]